MTQHTATCRISSGDEMVARIDESDIEIAARQDDADQMTVFLRPSVARTWARGILALADEVDGGEATNEAPADTRPKVGDRLRVTKNGANFAPVRAGDIITVAMVGYDNIDGRDFVRAYLEPGDDYAYFLALEYVEPVTEQLDAPIAVGDRVEIVRAERVGRGDEGRTGVVSEVDADDDRLPYRVVDDEGVFIAWAREVRRVDEPEPSSEPAASPFTAHVDEAKRLLADTDHTGADILALAVELADRS